MRIIIKHTIEKSVITNWVFQNVDKFTFYLLYTVDIYKLFLENEIILFFGSIYLRCLRFSYSVYR